MFKRVANYALPLLALFFVCWMVFTIFAQRVEVILEPNKSLLTPQRASIPLGIEAQFDPRFCKITSLEAFRIPTVSSFSAPLGTAHGGFSYVAQDYWEYNDYRGGYHTGVDYNGIGGGDSDLGDPVSAIADGLVLFAGRPSEGWGNVVILGHRLPNGDKIIQSYYAHLQRRMVLVGEMVSRGQQIGTVGGSPAHLHFEIRRGGNLYPGPGYVKEAPVTSVSLDEVLEYTDLSIVPYQVAEPWQRIRIENAHLLLERTQPDE